MSDVERAEPHMPDSPDTYNTSAPTATVSSLKSEDSTEHLICKTPQKTKKIKDVQKERSVTSKSVEAGSEASSGGSRLVVWLGLGQVVLGALLVGAGAACVVKGAALSRVGAGLWAGCVAVVTGVVGVLAGINDCYGLYGVGSRSPLLTAFLALSLLCLACGNSAAVLAASGLQRDAQRAAPAPHASFDDEMQAWSPVLTNIALLIIASLHCLVCVATIYHLSRRVCPCFRAKQAFDHNQFEPGLKAPPTMAVRAETAPPAAERARRRQLGRDLEAKLQPDAANNKKQDESGEFDSANSKEKLVSRWLGRHGTATMPGARARRGTGAAAAGVRKARPPPPPQVVLLPAHARPHPASTLGRVGATCVLVPPRYATLPPPPPAPLYYPYHDHRVRRRRSPRSHGERRRREHARERDSQLARSLERIHRKRRVEREGLTDAELKRTYTGLDRAYAEQFIAVIDESRMAAEHHDSLASTATSDSTNSQASATLG